MAGSLSHITAEDGLFRMELIENLGDAHEALEECHQIIAYLIQGWESDRRLRRVCDVLHYPTPSAVPTLDLERVKEVSSRPEYRGS